LNYIIEIATTDFTTTQSAVEGGADRIELCAALGDGGTTPSYGTIKKCRENFDVQLFPIIRPRSGDFFFHDQIDILKERGFLKTSDVVVSTGSTPVHLHLPTNVVKITKIE
jgi:copper homeostasis protein CutC